MEGETEKDGVLETWNDKLTFHGDILHSELSEIGNPGIRDVDNGSTGVAASI